MKVSDLIEAMTDAGAPMAAILIAVRALEERDAELTGQRDILIEQRDTVVEELDAVVERKRAADRERKRRQRANSAGGHGTVTGQSQEAPLSRPPNENNSNPPTHTPPEKTPARKGTRLAEDWEPSELKGQAAEMVKRWPPGAIERELAKFRNYWPAKPGKDGIKSDWQKTWVNWLISADERIPKNGASKTPDGRSMGRTEAAARNVLTRLGIDPDGGGESPPSPGIASDYRGRTVALPNPMRPQRFNAG